MRSLKTVEDVKQFIEKEAVKIIDFKVVDMKGRWHHLSIPVERFTKEVMTSGIGFDGSSYGFLTVEKSDMVFIPDLTTGFLDPFSELRTLVFIANIFRLKDGQRIRFEDDPRHMADKAEKYLKDRDIADKALFGPEFEFYVLDHISYTTTTNHMEVKIDSKQAAWNSSNSDQKNLGLKVQRHGGYHLDAPFDSSYDFRNQTVRMLEDHGVPVKYHHSENGGPGQVEIEVEFATLKEMADRTLKLKYMLKNNAFKNQLTTTFMPKPFVDEAGSGMHIHMHFFNGDKPLFYDKDGYSQLSDMALYAIGGILKHAASIMPFTNPSTNSYKRLVPGYEAPVSICFGTANRSAVIRIPGYTTEPDTKRFELRSPDATANPYLAYTAMLMAAIDGIENKIDPTKEGFGPLDINLYKLSDSEREKIKGLPANLIEACDALEKDHEFLLKGDVFSEVMIKNQIERLKKEHYYISSLPHPEEFKMYYEL
ncbi:MAG: type I glutamate--ammonia ligase [Erysipelotrichaceae bacterium]|nr:type I glutamate--ammonia ligase [Erysipelotrichaceae bacterium]